MRIALVSQEYPPETAKGGIGSQTYAKAHGLAALGHEVRVLSRATGAERVERWDGPVRVTRGPGIESRLAVYTPSADWVTYSGEVAAALAGLHAETPFDLVDFPEWGAEGYVHLLNQSKWNRIPTVIQLHGPLVMLAHTLGWPELDSEFYRTGMHLEGTCLRLADAIFSSSRCSAEWCARHYGIRGAEIPVLHTGVDTELFRPSETPKAARPTILFVGKLELNKGVRQLVEAAIELAAEFSDLRLRLLGRGSDRMNQELQALVKARGVPGLLELAGFVPREELPAQLGGHQSRVPS